MFLGLGDGCKKIHTDITIPSHTAKEHMANAVGTPLYNADKAVNAKHSKYKDEYDRETETFLPLALESCPFLLPVPFPVYASALAMREHLGRLAMDLLR
jgi:hypothetical protein